jgi:hypothetical protein
MKAIIEKTLSKLAQIDSGTLHLILDEGVYPETVTRAFAAASKPHYTATVNRSAMGLNLTVIANDPIDARLQIGMALTDLLQFALRHRK